MASWGPGSPSEGQEDGYSYSGSGFTYTSNPVTGKPSTALAYAFWSFPNVTLSATAAVMEAYFVNDLTSVVKNGELNNSVRAYVVLDTAHDHPTTASENYTDYGLKSTNYFIDTFSTAAIDMTGDLGPAVVELLRTEGWSSGGTIGVIATDPTAINGQYTVHDDYENSDPATLDIEYMEGISVGQAGQASGSSLSVPYPDIISAGDTLLLYTQGQNSAHPSSTPTGFTVLTSADAGSGEGDTRVYYKSAAGTESGSLSITFSDTTVDVKAVMLCLFKDYWGLADPDDTAPEGGGATGSSGGYDAPSLTPSFTPVMYIVSGAGEDDAYNWVQSGSSNVRPSGYSKLWASYSGSGSQYAEIYLSFLESSSSPEDPAATVTTITGNDWEATIVAVAAGGTDDTATPATVATAVTIPAPTLGAGSGTSPATVAATVAIPAPTITYGGLVAPATVAATIAIPTPSTGSGASTAPATVAASVAINAPTITYGGAPAPATVATTMAIPAPTVTTKTTTAPDTVAAVVAIPAVTTGAGWGVSPATVATTVAMYSPDIAYGGLIAPDAVAASIAIPAPTIAYGGLISPDSLALVVAIPAPTTHAGWGVAPATVATTVAMYSPDIAYGGNPNPASVAMTITIPAPASIIGGISTVYELFLAQATQIEEITAQATQTEEVNAKATQIERMNMIGGAP